MDVSETPIALSKLSESEVSDSARRRLKKIIAIASVKLIDASSPAVEVQFEDVWAAYSAPPERDEYKGACLKVFQSKLDEGYAADDIIAGAHIAFAKGWNNRYPYKWIQENRWLSLLQQFGGGE